MNSTRLLSTAVVVCLFSLVGCGKSDSGYSEPATPATPAANTLTQAEIDAGWTLLFDGKTTKGWKGYGHDGFPTKGWRIADGTLIVEASNTGEEGFGGDIITTTSYGSFDLSVDFQLTDTANSGIFFHVVENDDDIWNNAPEYQLLDDATYMSMGDDMSTHLTGDNYDIHSATVRPNKPIGEWNTARIVVDGAHVEHWLNGQKTVEYELWTPDWKALVKASKFNEFPAYGLTKQGPIGLQDHGHKVSFRNIKIRPL